MRWINIQRQKTGTPSRLPLLPVALEIMNNIKIIQSVEPSTWQPKLLIAVDGDYSKSIVENGYPGAEITASFLSAEKKELYQEIWNKKQRLFN